MCKIICITNRNLCNTNYMVQIENIAKAGPDAIVLREKDLSPYEYASLAGKVREICNKYNVVLILHNFVDVALSLNIHSIHLPLHIFKTMSDEVKSHFTTIGVSCHSLEEAVEAQQLGCSYIFAGHIFATDCKKDVPPRGTEFLNRICNNVTVPVYAIGGINALNIDEAIKNGAKGACIMSGFMKEKDVKSYLDNLKLKLNK